MPWINIDYGKLNVESKSLTTAILILIPFEFVAIYLFKHSVIEKIEGTAFLDVHFWLIILLGFCICIVKLIYSTFFISVIISVKRVKNKKKRKKKKETRIYYLWTGLLIVVQTCIAIHITRLLDIMDRMIEEMLLETYLFLCAATGFALMILVSILKLVIPGDKNPKDDQ